MTRIEAVSGRDTGNRIQLHGPDERRRGDIGASVTIDDSLQDGNQTLVIAGGQLQLSRDLSSGRPDMLRIDELSSRSDGRAIRERR